MIISMPCDQIRTSQLSYQFSTSQVRVLSAAQGPFPSQIFKGWIASWLLFCSRCSGQTAPLVDVYVWQSERAWLNRSLAGKVMGDSTFAAFAHDLVVQLASAAFSAPQSNCAFFIARHLDEASSALEKINSEGYELALLALEKGDKLELTLAYNANLCLPASIEGMLDNLVYSGQESRGTAALDAIPILLPAAALSQRLLLESGPGPQLDRSVIARIEARARISPDSPAVHAKGQTLSYAQLMARSHRLAALLQHEGIQAGSVVALCSRPSVDVLVGILAIFRLGGIYLPLDPTHPAAFIKHMLDTAAPRIVLLQDEWRHLSCFADLRLLSLEALSSMGSSLQGELTLPPEPGLDQPAYIFFTSGTTGKPKGVQASQRNLAHYLRLAEERFGFGEKDVFCSLARYTFSISFFELLSPLCLGAQLFLFEREDVFQPDRLLRLLEPVSVLHAGPSLLSILFRYLKDHPEFPQTLSHLRHVSSGGDVVPATVMEEMKRVFDRAELFVIYGSTEISCMGCYFPLNREKTITRSLVGRAFPGVKLRVVDAQLTMLPLGVVGEICIAGAGLVWGYLGLPALTAEKFVTIEGERYYRMGDLGRLNGEGQLEILGRRDDQIQLRGMRIELMGIENTVRVLGLARQCALVLKKEPGDELLVAFVVGAREQSIALFRRALAAELPDYMLPHRLVHLEQMPLTTNGKIDRQQLARLPWQTISHLEEVDQTPARGALEEGLLNLFRQSLNRPHLGVKADFFDNGGHSLLAVALLQDIRDQLKLAISPQMFFENPSVDRIVQQLGAKASQQPHPIPLNAAKASASIFMLSGVHVYRALAFHLAGQMRVYGVYNPLELLPPGSQDRALSVEELAAAYVAQIRNVQAQGPYRLLGYSFAGIVAYEAAQQLRAAGAEVSMLILLDAMLPEWNHRLQFRYRQFLRLWKRPWRDLAAFSWRRLRERLPSSIGVARFEADQRLGPLEAQRDLINSQAAAAYMSRMQAYGAPCLLIVSEERLRVDPLKSRSCGWRPFIPQLQLESVSGDHFQMLEREEDLSQIASMIIGFHRFGAGEESKEVGEISQKRRES